MMTTAAAATERPTVATPAARRLETATVARAGGGRSPRRPSAGIRVRILVGFVGMLAVATTGSVLVARHFLLARLDERINAGLVQEASELRQLAAGIDPETGRLFDRDARRIFDVFLERNTPLPNEAFLRAVTHAAQSISESDLSRRIVVEGADEDAGAVVVVNAREERLAAADIVLGAAAAAPGGHVGAAPAHGR